MHTFSEIEYIFLEALVKLGYFDSCDFESLTYDYKENSVKVSFIYIPEKDNQAIITSYNELLNLYNKIKEALLENQVDSELISVAPYSDCVSIKLKLVNLHN